MKLKKFIGYSMICAPLCVLLVGIPEQLISIGLDGFAAYVVWFACLLVGSAWLATGMVLLDD